MNDIVEVNFDNLKSIAKDILEGKLSKLIDEVFILLDNVKRVYLRSPNVLKSDVEPLSTLTLLHLVTDELLLDAVARAVTGLKTGNDRFDDVISRMLFFLFQFSYSIAHDVVNICGNVVKYGDDGEIEKFADCLAHTLVKLLNDPTYLTSRVSRIIETWREVLEK